jgi:hypothetical protein
MADWLACTVTDGKEIARSLMARLSQQDPERIEIEVFATLSALKMMRESLIGVAEAKMSEDERTVFARQVELLELASVIQLKVKKAP